MEEYTVHSGGGRFIERNSLHPVVDYGMEMSESQRKRYSGCNRLPTSIMHSPSNGHQPETLRALIDAYGTEKSQECPSSKPLLVEQMDRNCMDNKVWSTSWQNTEEEEFDWEEIKPTLMDNKSLLLGFSRERTVVAANATLSEQEVKKGWSSGSQLPPLNDSSAMVMKHSPVTSHDARKSFHHPSISSQHIFSNRGQARALTNLPNNHIGNSYVKPYGVRHAVPITPPIVKRAVNNCSLVSAQSVDTVENKDASITHMHQFPKKLSGQISSNQHNHWKAPQPQFFPSPRDPSTSQFSHEISSLKAHGASTSTPMLNPLPAMQFPSPLQRNANHPFHPGHPPASSQMMIPHPNVGPFMSTQQPPVGHTTDLLASLISHGVISLDKLLPAQNSIGTEFNADILKVRHESVVNSLYSDLPRQCRTCGLRFRSQEEHRSHMDWHVTKNRMSKSRKQKPSRKWFVSDWMWLSSAEALGTNSGPAFFSTETTEEKKDNEEVAVPAEEDQKTCALCEEPFDEFYSDEMEDRMYRGAAYLYQPTGTLAAMDRSQLGPIIHAKCRSESKRPPSQHLGKNDYEEGTPRKRMRV